jgi:pSer/pThr/pTyr-binding forkhead associated (FHA) protein
MRTRAPVSSRRAARLVVIKGTANIPEMAIEKARTNIGRTIDVNHTDGPSRRNDLAFSDESPVNRTVSREHAHILFSKTRGEYRLFNDRTYTGANCGLWILRDGLSQAVHRDARGVRLRSGDEIHFGSAVVRFLAR